MTELENILRQIFIQNELGGNESLIYEFSDADGERTGKSGYSFGICQLDIANNPYALLCLEECEFTTDEIRALKGQLLTPIGLSRINAKLKSHAEIIDKYDNIQIHKCIDRVRECSARGGFTFENNTAFLMACDYHNQFNFSIGGKFYTFCEVQKFPIDEDQIQGFKLNLLWGQKRPDDVLRRYENIKKIIQNDKDIEK